MVKETSRDDFIRENIPLVHSLCGRFTGKGIEYDDLFQAGSVGLVKAADNFDSSRGLCFSTYAVPVILGEIRRLFRDGGTVKVSRSIKELSFKVNRAASTLENSYGRQATVAEIAEYLGCSSEDVTEAVCASRPTVSLTANGDDGDSQLDLPIPGPEDTLSDKLLLDRAISALSEREQKLIRLRYYNSLTQNETACRLGMSQVQVSRIEKRALKKMRDVIGNVS